MKEFTFQANVPDDETLWDLVVAGAGPAGCAAAVAAGRAGAKVLLIEATGMPGGMGTAGLVNAFDPMTDGKRNIVAGFMKELVEDLYERGELGPLVTPEWWNTRYLHWTPFSVEGLKLLLDEKLEQAGVRVMFFTTLIAADADAQNKRLKGVIVNSIEGLRHISGKAFIDATGDAILSHLSGVKCQVNTNPMPCSLCSLHTGIDWDVAAKADQLAALAKAIDDGHFSQRDFHLPGMVPVSRTEGYLNAGHLFGLNALYEKDRSQMMVKGRKLLREYVSFYRKYVPGYEHLQLIASAPLIGVRETRRIVGEYVLNYGDYLARRHFPDQIGVFNKYIDIHVKDESDKEFHRFSNESEKSGRLLPGETIGLPYGILVPKGWQNLWVAGRCASSDERVHGSIRVQPAAVMMGQAAGTAAVQALTYDRIAQEVDTAQLVKDLRQQGAYLPQETLTSKMTVDNQED